MSNTLDTVLVKYRGKNEEDEEKEPVTVPEFLKIPAKQLTDMEHRVQKALAFIYEQNGKEPPLFLEFADSPEAPLTIDCLNLPKKQSKKTIAWYSPGQNLIGFEQTWKKVDLINTISHELKHAEQFSKECFELEVQYIQEKNEAKSQKLKLVKETQAQIFGTYVSMLKCKGRKIPKRILKDLLSSFYNGVDKDGVHFPGVKDLLEEQPDVTKWNYQEIEKRLLPASYISLLKSGYKKDYDCDMPIKMSDLQDQNIHIPSSFRITGPTDFISDFSYEKVKTPFGRLMQLIANPSDTLTDEDIKLIESEDKKYGEYLLNSTDEKKKRKEHRLDHFDIDDYNAEARISIYLDYLCSHGREDRVFELLNSRSHLLTKIEKKRFLYHYHDKLADKLYEEKRQYQPEHMKLLEMKDKRGKWLLDNEGAQEEYLTFLCDKGQEAHAWDLFEHGGLNAGGKGQFIDEYVGEKIKKNESLTFMQRVLIEAKEKNGEYPLKACETSSDTYTKYLLLHGMADDAIQLFKQKRCDQMNFLQAYVNYIEDEGKPITPELMALIETTDKKGQCLAAEHTRRDYINFLLSHGQQDHVWELLQRRNFWQYEAVGGIRDIDATAYLSEFLRQRCQKDTPFTKAEMAIFEGTQKVSHKSGYILDSEDQELYINHLIKCNPGQWPHAADLVFNKRFFDLDAYEEVDKENYWRKQVFLSKYLNHKIDENKPLTKKEMKIFEIKLKNMEPASFNEKYSEKDNFEANFKDDYFMHPMLRQKYIHFLIDHGQEKRAYQLLEDCFDRKEYYFNKTQPQNINTAAMKTQSGNVAAMDAPNDNTAAPKADGDIATPKGPDISIAAAMKAIKDKHNQL